MIAFRKALSLGAGTSVTSISIFRNSGICRSSSLSKENVTRSTAWSLLICLRRLNVRIFPPVSAGRGNLGAMKRMCILRNGFINLLILPEHCRAAESIADVLVGAFDQTLAPGWVIDERTNFLY